MGSCLQRIITTEIKNNLEAIQQLEKIKSKQLLKIDEIKQSKLQIQEKLETVTKQNEILQNQINQEEKYEELWQVSTRTGFIKRLSKVPECKTGRN